MWPNDQAQAQPPARGPVGNNDVRVSRAGQLAGAAAVAGSALFGRLLLQDLNGQNQSRLGFEKPKIVAKRSAANVAIL